MQAVEVNPHHLNAQKKVKVIRKKILKSTRRKTVYKRNDIIEITTKIMTPQAVTQMLNIRGRKKELIQVLGHLTDATEQLAGIGREKEIVKGEVEDTGTHWNMKEKERGTESEKEIERGRGCGREREGECLHH